MGPPAVKVFLCPRLLFVGSRLQLLGPPLSPRGQIQMVVDQGTASAEARGTTSSQIGGAQAWRTLTPLADASPSHGYESEAKSKAARSCPTLRSHGLQPTGLLGPWNFPGKSTRAGCHFLLQGIFLTQGWNLSLLRCWQTLYRLSRSSLNPVHPCWDSHVFVVPLSVWRSNEALLSTHPELGLRDSIWHWRT